MNINKRLYNCLFVNKDVLWDRELYWQNYRKIWFDEEAFKLFLETSDPDIKLNCAKEIFDKLTVVEDILLPISLVTNVIKSQYSLVKDTSKYIPQDHIIHSINTYILGIYLFFNYKFFNELLLENMESQYNLDEKFCIFIRQWRTFSFYHDMGYYLETHIDSNGEFKTQHDDKDDDLSTYLSIDSETIRDYAIRYVVRILTQAYLIEHNNNILNQSKLSYLKSWLDENPMPYFNSEKIEGYFNCRIFHLDDKGIDRIMSVAFNREAFFYIEDEQGQLVDVAVLVDNEIVANHTKTHKIQSLIDLRALLYQGYHIYYCINGLIKDKQLCDLDDFDWIVQDSSLLPSFIESRIDFLVTLDDVFEFEKDLYTYFTSIDETSRADSFNVDSFSLFFKNKVDEILEKMREKNETIFTIEHMDKLFARLLNKFEKKSQEIKAYVGEKIIEQNNKQLGSPAAFYNMKKTRTDIFKKIFASDDNEIKLINEIDNAPITIDFTYFKRFAKQKNDIVKYLDEFANNLEIQLKDLIKYNPSHSICDHGLVSAGLVCQSLDIALKIVKKDEGKSSYRFEWFFDNERINIYNADVQKAYAHAVFSIMLHNVYAGKKKHQLYYMQDVKVDSFSYFCAFCDWLQKWDRPKQINYAHAKLPAYYFTGENYDFVIDDNKIKIITSESNRDELKKDLKTAQTYMKGIEHLVCV